MLPDFLRSGYKTYKADTDAVATWLALQAKQCGYAADLLDQTSTPSAPSAPSASVQSSGRLKGKARKQANGNVGPGPKNVDKPGQEKTSTGPTYTIKIKDFLILAEYICASTKPVARVPVAIVKALNRAIKLRREHYSKATQSSEGTDNGVAKEDTAHLHFLGVLEKTHEILRPRMPPELLEDVVSRVPSDGQTVGDTDDPNEKDLANRFEALEVEEPSQAFLDAPNVEPSIKPDNKSLPRYQPEPIDDVQEEYLAAHLLFEDLRAIRSAVKWLWQGYQKGLDVAAVSVTVSAAISFVRDLEQEYLEIHPNRTDYQGIMRIFFIVQCFLRGEDPGHKQRPGDLINFAVYDLAEEAMLPTYSTIASLSDILKPNIVPLYKPGHFGVRDKTRPWSEKSPREKHRDDQITIFEISSDLFTMAVISEKNPLVEDDLIRGIRGMAPGKPIPCWLVFAMQCFLDAQHVLEDDTEQPFAELQTYCSAIQASFSANLEFHRSLRVPNWPKQNDILMEQQLKSFERWIMTDVVGQRLKKFAVSMGCENDKLLLLIYLIPQATTRARYPDPEPFRLLKQHPLLCGLFLFTTKMQYQEIGVSFVNAWGSVMYCAHLYNAVRQEKLLSRIWRDMEFMITLQSPETLFIGNPPTELGQYLKRFLLSMGYSAANMAKGRRGHNPVASARGPKGLKDLASISHVFTDRFCNNAQNFSWTMETLQPLIDAKVDNDFQDGEEDTESALPTDKKETTSRKAKKNRKKTKPAASGALIIKAKRSEHNMPIVHFLQDLVQGLSAEKMETTFDYLIMHRFCWKLLRSVNMACQDQLRNIYGGGYLDEEYRLPFIVGYIFLAADNASSAAGLLPKKEGVKVNSKVLATAADALTEVLGTGANSMGMKRLELLGLSIDFSQMEG